MNSVNISGNLVSAPTVRGTDKKVASFTVAVRANKEHTDFVRCAAFGKTAEYLEKYASKGDRIAVSGSLHVGSYEKDGQKVTTNEVYANNVELIGGKAGAKDTAPAEEEDALPFN